MLNLSGPRPFAALGQVTFRDFTVLAKNHAYKEITPHSNVRGRQVPRQHSLALTTISIPHHSTARPGHRSEVPGYVENGIAEIG